MERLHKDGPSRLLKNVGEAGKTRQKQPKKRSLRAVNEHFEAVFNAVLPTQVVFQRPASKQLLGSFAVNYAKAQNVEEVAEFGGGAVFELVLAALLVVFTGGVGLAARGAASVRHAALLKRLSGLSPNIVVITKDTQ